jgi:hypothetical protein
MKLASHAAMVVIAVALARMAVFMISTGLSSAHRQNATHYTQDRGPMQEEKKKL